jgi:NAD(P)-dependent dehydrogenase (short-subunit alcohol dehydrogenase family)
VALSALCNERGYERAEVADADIAILSAREAKPMTLEEAELSDFIGEVDRHLKAAFLLSREAAQAMLSRTGGAIVLVGSGDADKPNGYAIGFAAAMGGIRLLFRELAYYTEGTSVRVNLLETGERGDHDNPAVTAAQALSIAENEYLSGCEIRTRAAHYHMK